MCGGGGGGGRLRGNLLNPNPESRFYFIEQTPCMKDVFHQEAEMWSQVVPYCKMRKV